MDDPTCVLLVDDDEYIRDMLSEFLDGCGYRVMTADSAASARERMQERMPSVVLLDVGLPGEDGLSLARSLRDQQDVGIIMVSGAGDTVDRIIGLEVGADDYIAKPFDLRELRARLKSVLRRYQRPGPAETLAAAGRRVRFGAAWLDLQSRLLFSEAGEEIPITAAEFELLKVFAERPRRPLSRDQLMSLTQNRDWDPYDRSIDIRIARLRKKVEHDPSRPRAIKTMRGTGYMFVPES